MIEKLFNIGKIGKSVKARAAGAIGSLAVGYGISSLLGYEAGRMKTYMGERAYERKYGTAQENISAVLRGAALASAGAKLVTGRGLIRLSSKLTGAGLRRAGRMLTSKEKVIPSVYTTMPAGGLRKKAMPKIRRKRSLIREHTTFGVRALLVGGAVGSMDFGRLGAGGPGEGNITAFGDNYDSSIARKVNYSTAGLSLALHYNRKM